MQNAAVTCAGASLECAATNFICFTFNRQVFKTQFTLGYLILLLSPGGQPVT